VLLRHDIDRVPANALAMAELEHQLGISSTYYVRTISSVYRESLLHRLHELGHEVGYHYEVLSKTGGDVPRALDLFATELARMRQHAPVTTASSHGSPLSPWDNLSIWKHGSPADFGLRGEAYLQIDYTDVDYYTDTGRSWAATQTNLRDRVETHGRQPAMVHTTDELVRLVIRMPAPALCIQTHPERWNATRIGRIRSQLWDWAANTAKLGLRAARRSNVR